MSRLLDRPTYWQFYAPEGWNGTLKNTAVVNSSCNYSFDILLFWENLYYLKHQTQKCNSKTKHSLISKNATRAKSAFHFCTTYRRVLFNSFESLKVIFCFASHAQRTCMCQ